MPPLARWYLGGLLPRQSIARVIRRILERDQKDGSGDDGASLEGEGLLGSDRGSEAEDRGR